MTGMNLTRYLCTHCGRRFEAEEKEILECPGCFWSTSVKKEEDAAKEKQTSSDSKASSPPPALPAAFPPGLKKILPVVLIAAVGLGALFFLRPRLGNLKPSFKVAGRQKETADKQKIESAPSAAPPAQGPLETLTPEEKAVLARRLQVTADRPVGPEEQKILDQRASFETGFVEKLPSQAWTLHNFREIIAQQEKTYKVPLPSSYKKKLEKVFQEKYLPGQEAFKAGDLVKARNLWMESFIFPIYADNPAKHRGVVLTMLRPFINDTLSKIGAVNGALVEKAVRGKEQALSEAYQDLLSRIRKKSWRDSDAAVLALEQKLDELENPASLKGSPEPYPPSIRQVDPDIQAGLMEILAPPPPAVADLVPLRRDIEAKRRVIEGFLPDIVSANQRRADEALALIGRGEWEPAAKKLSRIETPPELSGDARQKIEILKKLAAAAGSSEGETGGRKG